MEFFLVIGAVTLAAKAIISNYVTSEQILTGPSEFQPSTIVETILENDAK